MPTVYIPNRSNHDFDAAKEFGELVYLTEGSLDRYDVSAICRDVVDVMSNSDPDDLLVIASLPVITSIAAALLAVRHGRVNFLLFKSGRYVRRTVKFTS
jgi:hypothetical protein